jgi:hypothetical protein
MNPVSTLRLQIMLQKIMCCSCHLCLV